MKWQRKAHHAQSRIRLWKFSPSLGCFVWIVCLTLVSASYGQTTSNGDVNQQLINRRVAALQTQLDSLDQEIHSLEQTIQSTEERIAQLIEELEAIELPKPNDEIAEAEVEVPEQISFRPPMLRESNLNTPLAIICHERQVFILDFEELDREVERRAGTAEAFFGLVFSGDAVFTAGDFEIHYDLVEDGFIQTYAERKAGRSGTRIEEISRTNSRLHRRLAECRSAEDAIQFVVYPDSYEIFRHARQIVWSQGFSTIWVPHNHQETKIGVGSGVLDILY